MGAILGKGVVNGLTKPAVQVWLAADAQPLDPEVLEFQIFRVATDAEKLVPVQVYPATEGERAVIDTSEGGVGRIAAGIFAPSFSLSGTAGRHQVRYFYRAVVADAEQEVRAEFELVEEAGIAIPFLGYCLPCDLRDEGLSLTAVPEARLRLLIRAATRTIDMVTDRFFTPKSLEMDLDGELSKGLLLRDPIIALETLTIVNTTLISSLTDVVDPSTYVVYNRHLRQQLTSPDDRESPKISFLKTDNLYGVGQDSDRLLLHNRLTFPTGVQNLRLNAWMGYTDPDMLYPGDQVGSTPDGIRQACMRLVLRDAPKLVASADELDERKRARIISESTGEQSYSLEGNHLKGVLTGDSEIDLLLVQYMRPAHIRAS